jgi:hypothetical protein
MMNELSNRVRWVSRTYDATSPVRAPRDGRRVDAVLREESQDIVFLPVPFWAQTGAESNGCVSEVREGVIAACDGILVDYYIHELVNTLKTDREGREKYHGNQGTASQDDRRSRSRCLSSGFLFPGVCMPFFLLQFSNPPLV